MTPDSTSWMSLLLAGLIPSPLRSTARASSSSGCRGALVRLPELPRPAQSPMPRGAAWFALARSLRALVTTPGNCWDKPQHW